MTFTLRRKRRPGVTVAGIFSVAVGSALLLCGAGLTPTGNVQRSDINANGFSLTNAATVSGSNAYFNNVAATNQVTTPTIYATTVYATNAISGPGSGITGMAGNTAESISAASTTTLTSQGRVSSDTIMLAAGSGAYTVNRSFSDSTGSPQAGDLYFVNLLWPSSTNPTVAFYDTSTSGTALGSYAGTANGGVSTLQFVFNGTHWVHYSKGEVASRTLGAGVSSALTNAVEAPGGLAVSMPRAFSSAQSGKKIDFMGDDDGGGDPDGWKAVATSCSLARLGYCRLVGWVCDIKTAYGAPAMEAEVSSFGYGNVPVGSYTGSVSYSGAHNICDTLAGGLLNGLFYYSGLTYPEETSTQTYRRVFASELAAGNVNQLVVTVTGAGSAFYDFAHSGADSISPYTGQQLITMVNPLVVVGGGSASSGSSDTNFGYDTTAAAYWSTVAGWIPGHVKFVPYQNSGGSGTGMGFTQANAYDAQMPTNSPSNLVGNNITIYDPVSVLYAVMGDGWGGTTYFAETAGTNAISGSGNTWTAGAGNEVMLSYGGGGSSAIDPILQSLITQAEQPTDGLSTHQQLNLSTGSQTVPLTLTSSGTTGLEFISTSGSSYDSIYAQIGSSGLNIYDGTAGSTPLGAKGGAQNQVTTSSDGVFGWLNSATYQYGSLDTALARAAEGSIKVTNGSSGLGSFLASSVSADAVGYGLQVKEGSNAKQGTATLSGGTVTVSDTAVTANSRILLTIQSASGTVGTPYISARSAGTSFTITSTSGSDASTVAYEIFEPAP